MSPLHQYTSGRPRARGGRRLAAVVPLVAVALLAASAQTASAAPPAPPTGLAVSPAAPTSATSVTASWSTTDPVASAHWEVCPVAPDGGDVDPASCRTGEVAGDASQLSVPTPDEGTFSLAVWLENSAGEEGARATAAEPLVIDRTAPERPVNVFYDGRTVTWDDPAGQLAPIVRVHWKLCRGWGDPTNDPCLTGTSDQHGFALPEETLPLGPPEKYCDSATTIATIYLEDAAGNVNPANVTGRGHGGTASCAAPPVIPPIAEPVARRDARLTIGARWGSVRSTGARKVTLTAASPYRGTAAGKVRFRVTGQRNRRAYTRIRTVSLRGGRATFAVTIPKGLRRLTVATRYSGSAMYQAGSKSRVLRVPRG